MKLATLVAIASLVAARDAAATACEFSALRFVPCPEGRTAPGCLLIGDNETADHVLLYSLAAQDRLAGETPVTLVAADANETAPKIDDIEAIEVDGERIWIVASHGRKRWRDEETDPEKQCAVDGGRLAIFEGTWSPATPMKSLAGSVTKTKKKDWSELLRSKCKSELFQLDVGDATGRALAAQACAQFAANDEHANQQRDACESAFNVEGAAAIPGKDGKRRLWLGLRGPTLDGKALLLRWKPGDELRFDGIATVDLGERRGVRDLAFAGDRLWLLGGPTADSTDIEFALEAAPLASLESGAQLTPKLVRKVREQSEGLAIFADGRHAAIVTDGDKGDSPDAACKVPSAFFSVPIE